MRSDRPRWASGQGSFMDVRQTCRSKSSVCQENKTWTLNGERATTEEQGDLKEPVNCIGSFNFWSTGSIKQKSFSSSTHLPLLNLIVLVCLDHLFLFSLITTCLSHDRLMLRSNVGRLPPLRDRYHQLRQSIPTPLRAHHCLIFSPPKSLSSVPQVALVSRCPC